MIAKTVHSHQRDWDEVLPHVLAAYRASLHETTGFIPNYLLFGREARAPLDLVSPDAHRATDTYATYVQDLADRKEEAYKLVRERLKVQAERRSHTYDLRVRRAEYHPCQKVYYFEPRRRSGRSPKWSHWYTGPFDTTRSG